MRVAIMQPYFFPYIGYFQLISAVDEFIVYDNIEYSKGWINRNRVLLNGKDVYITLPLKRDSDFKHIIERTLADSWPVDKKKMLNKIKECYRAAPFFKDVYQFIGELISNNESNLFRYLFHTINETMSYLGISTPLIVSSSVAIDHRLKAEEKVLALLKERKANEYINPIGGINLYSKEWFKERNIDLFFLQTNNLKYPQKGNAFVPNLSIIDVLMYNSSQTIREFLDDFTLI